MSDIQLAIVSDFHTAEKLLESLEKTSLSFDKVCAVELEPFNEEQALRFHHSSLEQLKLAEVNWSQFSYVLFAGKPSNAELLAEMAQAGCVVLDLYGLTALISDVPVIVPSVNDEDLVNLRERNIVALANPQISQLVLALKPLRDQPIQQVFVTSLLSSAYFGEKKVQQLAGQTAQLLNGVPLDSDMSRVAFDTVPSNVQDDEAMLPFSKAFVLQLAKIMPNLTACTTFHSVQVPLFYGASQMVTVQSEFPLDAVELSEQWKQQSWLTFNEDVVITPVKNGEDEEINTLQISQLISKDENAIQFWSVNDEQRFSVAFLGIQLLERVLKY
ncbi:oxidoreductase [Pasteurella skyensis]|uniref:Oxidoreductase n=1 Tax=Phocoenobacter skyensis TaxID=97481 RepID=A0AAJ6NZZ7_9PAST|nr:oxidoreductase [Pasteurella skyensis]MDP8161986.1 oxidoreductase [Pasteurella skyensis]MDP8172142.1 oxidoreductase [Pasteurella skyensis]MDP8176510.1 oxidoreductase [Pasteurella skyensis]MDP8178398.1 oxidoreductase [Pasteurella skyensis]MDP8182846.1 oxidoreductase [Pasteurella skyensis]